LLVHVESEKKTLEIAENLRQRVQHREIDIGNGKKIKKTISIGVSMFPVDDSAIWQSIKYADVALYEAKRTGRNKVVRFEHKMWDEYNKNSV
jgi:diguanylate cyclase (GGDEF)-like protein